MNEKSLSEEQPLQHKQTVPQGNSAAQRGQGDARIRASTLERIRAQDWNLMDEDESNGSGPSKIPSQSNQKEKKLFEQKQPEQKFKDTNSAQIGHLGESKVANGPIPKQGQSKSKMNKRAGQQKQDTGPKKQHVAAQQEKQNRPQRSNWNMNLPPKTPIRRNHQFQSNQISSTQFENRGQNSTERRGKKGHGAQPRGPPRGQSQLSRCAMGPVRSLELKKMSSKKDESVGASQKLTEQVNNISKNSRGANLTNFDSYENSTLKQNTSLENHDLFKDLIFTQQHLIQQKKNKRCKSLGATPQKISSSTRKYSSSSSKESPPKPTMVNPEHGYQQHPTPDLIGIHSNQQQYHQGQNGGINSDMSNQQHVQLQNNQHQQFLQQQQVPQSVYPSMPFGYPTVPAPPSQQQHQQFAHAMTPEMINQQIQYLLQLQMLQQQQSQHQSVQSQQQQQMTQPPQIPGYPPAVGTQYDQMGAQNQPFLIGLPVGPHLAYQYQPHLQMPVTNPGLNQQHYNPVAGCLQQPGPHLQNYVAPPNVSGQPPQGFPFVQPLYQYPAGQVGGQTPVPPQQQQQQSSQQQPGTFEIYNKTTTNNVFPQQTTQNCGANNIQPDMNIQNVPNAPFSSQMGVSVEQKTQKLALSHQANCDQKINHSLTVEPTKSIIEDDSFKQYAIKSDQGTDVIGVPKANNLLTKLITEGPLDLSFQTNSIPTDTIKHALTSTQNTTDHNQLVKTDPNSVYRQLFNRDLSFFLYVIDNTEAPHSIKLHITTLLPNELTDEEVVQSIRRFVQEFDLGEHGEHGAGQAGKGEEEVGKSNRLLAIQATQNQEVGKAVVQTQVFQAIDSAGNIGIEVKQFPMKCQIKVFLIIQDSKKERAKNLFQCFYKTSDLSIIDQQGQLKFERKMRAYLVKDEGTFEKLANVKFFDDLKKKTAFQHNNILNNNTSNVFAGQSSQDGLSSIQAHSNSFGSMMSRSVVQNLANNSQNAGRASQGRAQSRGRSSLHQRRNLYSGGGGRGSALQVNNYVANQGAGSTNEPDNISQANFAPGQTLQNFSSQNDSSLDNRAITGLHQQHSLQGQEQSSPLTGAPSSQIPQSNQLIPRPPSSLTHHLEIYEDRIQEEEVTQNGDDQNQKSSSTSEKDKKSGRLAEKDGARQGQDTGQNDLVEGSIVHGGFEKGLGESVNTEISQSSPDQITEQMNEQIEQESSETPKSQSHHQAHNQPSKDVTNNDDQELSSITPLSSQRSNLASEKQPKIHESNAAIQQNQKKHPQNQKQNKQSQGDKEQPQTPKQTHDRKRKQKQGQGQGQKSTQRPPKIPSNQTQPQTSQRTKKPITGFIWQSNNDIPKNNTQAASSSTDQVHHQSKKKKSNVNSNSNSQLNQTESSKKIWNEPQGFAQKQGSQQILVTRGQNNTEDNNYNKQQHQLVQKEPARRYQPKMEEQKQSQPPDTSLDLESPETPSDQQSRTSFNNQNQKKNKKNKNKRTLKAPRAQNTRQSFIEPVSDTRRDSRLQMQNSEIESSNSLKKLKGSFVEPLNRYSESHLGESATQRQGTTDELVYQKNIFANRKTQGSGRPRIQATQAIDEENIQQPRHQQQEKKPQPKKQKQNQYNSQKSAISASGESSQLQTGDPPSARANPNQNRQKNQTNKQRNSKI